VVDQYKLLLSNFSKIQQTSAFNFSDPQYAIPQTLTQQLTTLNTVEGVDPRLILDLTVNEVAGIALGQSSSQTTFVGDHRQGQSIVVGVDPADIVGSWSIDGRFLSNSSSFEAVVGDSLTKTMYVPSLKNKISSADPLQECIGINDVTLKIVGVCVDPLNNGYTTYVPIDVLQNATGLQWNNLLLVKLGNSTSRDSAANAVRSMVQASGYGLEVFDLNLVVEQNTGFLASTWQSIMLLPLFTLASAATCLVGYMMLAIDEQHQEFAILRAVGAKPNIIMSISSIQSAIVLLSSFAVGISLGFPTTLLILMKNPLITSLTIVEIAVWLLAALSCMFILSLYPAFRLAKTSILKIMA
jgi:ABC-type antimicrobial peptide transport system permease subunit